MTIFLKLIRWKNILIIVATMFAMKYAIILPICEYFNTPALLTQTSFTYLVFAIVFLISGGNVINDYFDRKADMINRPQEVLIVFSIKRRKAILIHITLSILGIICGIIASKSINKLSFSLLFIIVAIVLWMYSTSLRKLTIIRNIISSLLFAFIPLTVGVFEYYATTNIVSTTESVIASNTYLYIISGFSIFAFLYNLILGLIKDCLNYDGDKETGRNSVAVKFGKTNTNYIIGTMSLIFTSLVIIAIHVFLPRITLFENNKIILWYTYIFLIAPSFLLGIISLFGKHKQKYIILSALSKTIMFFGILFSFVLSFVIYGYNQ